MSHTPGPWTTDQHWIYAGCDADGGNAESVVAECLGGRNLASADTKPQLQVNREAAANARLIASAPELERQNAALLAACEAAHGLLAGAWPEADDEWKSVVFVDDREVVQAQIKTAIDLAKPPNVAAEKDTPPVFTFDTRSYDCLADLQADGFTEITVRNRETGEERTLVLPTAAEKPD